MIIQEATAVESRGRISSADLGIWDDSQIDGLKAIVDRIKEEGAVPAIQLAHAGRKCNAKGEDVIAPSPINFDKDDPEYVTPREMNREDIAQVVSAFKNAAERAQKAGYEVLEIHGAHGYLINEFLSPLTNTRSDEYGGSVQNRARFLKEVLSAVRSVWSDEKVIILRISAIDYGDGGNEPEDLAELINAVKDEGVDIVHVSTGGVISHAKIPLSPGYQIPAAKKVKELTGLPVVGGGLITDPQHVDDIISNEDAELVYLGRELLRNPYFPLLSAARGGIDLDYWPKQYARAK
jgi:NADPH2 dehydrogenase